MLLWNQALNLWPLVIERSNSKAFFFILWSLEEFEAFFFDSCGPEITICWITQKTKCAIPTQACGFSCCAKAQWIPCHLHVSCHVWQTHQAPATITIHQCFHSLHRCARSRWLRHIFGRPAKSSGDVSSYRWWVLPLAAGLTDPVITPRPLGFTLLAVCIVSKM